MNNEYINYPDDAMTWVYQSERFFSPEEKEIISQRITDFISQWDSHGSLVKGTFTIKHDAFIVIFADGEGSPLCGRAQSASVTLIKELEKELNLQLMDRMRQSYKDGDQVKLIKLAELKKLYQEGTINDETVVFDNTVINKKDFDSRWETPLKDSWHKRFV
ncbi:ABC transporter ATPase [Elizabethkingia sp. JS20170427COW]|uniref:ABC transporter ATPase n=1 Tax=Elizabethkingia sp. JS20170427COW TaxID=2583851 RepID=UPI001110E9FB|nr:ABC transporter ATPase [Elizabethkingia sp. JS20170427COW]QCX54069.1 ABC transporter ATPase [Elizabethkingia sp. JS20170427COW]